jgi:hypothetical protein
LARAGLQDHNSPETGGYPAGWPPWPGTGGCFRRPASMAGIESAM